MSRSRHYHVLLLVVLASVGVLVSLCAGQSFSSSVAGIAFEFFGLSDKPRGPQSIVMGPDDGLWFTEERGPGNRIGRLDQGGRIQEYRIPTRNCGASDIAAGPDNALWFTERRANKIGRISTDGHITEFPLRNPDAFPVNIIKGPDDKLWFTEPNVMRIGRMATNGTYREYTFSGSIGPIAGATDGRVWFILGTNTGQYLYWLLPSGRYARYKIPSSYHGGSGLAIGPDAAVWFTGVNDDRIFRMTPSGSFREFALSEPNSYPGRIVSGHHNALWFTERNGVARISTSGVTTQFLSSRLGLCSVCGLAWGSPGDLWIALYESDSIARVRISQKMGGP